MVITDIAERTLPAPMSKISVSLRMAFTLPLALAAAGNLTLAKAQTPSLIPQQQQGPEVFERRHPVAEDVAS